MKSRASETGPGADRSLRPLHPDSRQTVNGVSLYSQPTVSISCSRLRGSTRDWTRRLRSSVPIRKRGEIPTCYSDQPAFLIPSSIWSWSLGENHGGR